MNRITIASIIILVFNSSLTFGQIKATAELLDGSSDSLSVNSLNEQFNYEQALLSWKTVEDVNNWIKQNFSYWLERAKLLSENSPVREQTRIYTPQELFEIKQGICVDLSRFAVESINSIDSSKNVQYLMIEFDPISLDGSIIRKHWVAVYQDDSKFYLLGDSKRPGHIAGPYNSLDEFIVEYQEFRGRRIVDWKILASYQKKKKQKTMRQNRGD